MTDTKKRKTIRGLTDTLEKLRNKISELSKYEKMFNDLSIAYEAQKKQLEMKRSVVRVEQVKDNCIYILQITEVLDTPEGLLIRTK